MNHDGIIDPLRYMACYAASLKSCQSTAMMISTAQYDIHDTLSFRYTMVETAKIPNAIPIITINQFEVHQRQSDIQHGQNMQE